MSALVVAAAVQAGSLEISRLRCEYRENPLGLGEVRPRLTWQAAARDSAARGVRQTAWRVIVAATPEAVAGGRGDLWDSGRVAGDAVRAVYAGAPLGSRAQCWWAVKVWDENGAESPWSAPAHWTMGLLGADEFKAAWIGLDAARPTDGSAIAPDVRTRFAKQPWVWAPLPDSKTGPLVAHFRKVLPLPAGRKVTRAAFVLTPDMRCTITLNGQPAGEVGRWEMARPIDVTALLAPGAENVCGLRVEQDDGLRPAVLGELAVTFAEGEPLRIPVDGSWVWLAEAPAGWDRPGFDATAWQAPASITEARDTTRLRSPWGTPENATHWLPPAPYLRKGFTVAKPVKRATVYATALGIYELQLNGRRVGRDVFAPGWTEYSRRLHYQTYDVTPLVRAGANAVGALLGDGWYAGIAGYTGRRGYYGGLPRLRAQLELDYTDGTRETIATDGTWRGAQGAIRYADLYLGCAIDRRLAQPAWATAGFDDRTWTPVTTGLSAGTPDQFVLEAGTLEPPRTQEELPAKAVTQPRPGAHVYDLGQNLVGWVRLTVRGKAGQRVTLRHGEMLNPNGTLYTSNLRGAQASDVFWLRGGGDEVLEPWGTFHGFRYVEVTGLDQAPAPADVVGIVVHNALRRTGEFASSSALVNQLFHNIIWGQKGNYLEAPTDCPQRDERLGWTGDTQFFARTAMFNYDVTAFLERWLVTTIQDSQGPDGTFPDTVPAIGHKPKAVTAWGDAALLVTHALWLATGDTRPAERHYDRLARYIAFLAGRAKNGIVDIGGYGDWLHKGGGAKKEVMDTAYYAHLCGLMAELGTAIGRNAEAAQYAALRDSVVTAWRKEFLKPDGSILESSQTGFALAFTMGLLPDELKAKAAEKFVADIAAKDWHLGTGFIGTPRLLPALHLAGRDDVAYRLLLQETYPSWLFQVKLGATTMWERWDGWAPDTGFQTVGMNSFNHYAFGAVGEYLYRHVGGIDTVGAGFRQVVVAPQPGPGLTSASASYVGPTGRLASAWRVEGGTLTLDLSVPASTSATVRVPLAAGGDVAAVREGAVAAREAKGVEFVRSEPGAAVFRVGAGTYRFTAPAAAN